MGQGDAGQRRGQWNRAAIAVLPFCGRGANALGAALLEWEEGSDNAAHLSERQA